MPDEPIGSVRVDVVADYSKLAQGMQAAQGEAAKAGASIASSFTAAISPTSSLTEATIRLKAAQSALVSEGAKMLQQVQATAPGYQAAQAAIAGMNAELAAAQAAFAAAQAAAKSNAGATTAAANTAATAQQGLAAATQAVAAAMQTQTAAAGANVGAIMAGANAATGAAQATTSVGTAAAGASIPIFRLYTIAMLLKRALDDLDAFRKSEEQLRLFSKATGVSAQQIAQLQGAVAMAGGDASKFDGVVVHLARSISDAADGNAKMSDELRRLGVTTKDPVQAFFQIADTIHNTRDKMVALAIASHILGASETDLIAVMSEGSAKLKEHYAASEELAKARVAAIPDAQELTRVERELTAAFEETGGQVLPYLTGGIKGLATAFELLVLPVKLSIDAMIQGFVATEEAMGHFGLVMSDLVSGKFGKAGEDARSAVTIMKGLVHDAAASMQADWTETSKFLDKLWNPKAEKPAPDGEKDGLPPAAHKLDKKPEHELSKLFEDQLAELKADHEVGIFEEKRFQEARYAAVQGGIAGLAKLQADLRAQGNTAAADDLAAWQKRNAATLKGGNALMDLQVDIHRKIGNLNQHAMRQQHEAEIHEVTADAKDFQDQLARVMASAEETTGMPKTAGLDFVRAKLEAATISQGAYEDALKKIPELERGAAKESEDVIRRWVKTSEDIFAEGGARTAAEVSANAAQLIAVLKQMGGAEDEIAAQQKRKNAADKTVITQTLKIARVDAGGAAASAETDILARKIALQSAYEQQSFHTSQQQIAYAQQLSAYDEEIMRLKQGALEIDVMDALTAGDVVKANQAAAQWLHEDDAIRLHRLQTEAKIAEITRGASFSGQISTGLTKDAESAVSRLSSGIATLATQTKGWGQEFRSILKSIEQSIIETFASSALKHGLEAIENAWKSHQAGGGVLGTTTGAAGGAAATIGRSPAASIQMQAERANTTAVQALTVAIQRLIAEMQANTTATTAESTAATTDATAATANTAGLIANTAAEAANTIALYVSAAVGIFSSILGLFGGGGGSSISGGGGAEGKAKGGPVSAGTPYIVGEHGQEMFVPDTAGNIIPADRTRQLLAAATRSIGSFQFPQISLAPPTVADGVFMSANHAQSISSSTASSTVTNHNTGSIGAMHFAITEARNPRQTVREIANYMKLSSGKFSPFNK